MSEYKQALSIGSGRLSIEDVCRVARAGQGVALADGDFPARIERGAAFLAGLLADGGEVYGVNTGYGDNCTVSIPPALVAELPLHLTRYHGCGLGDYLDEAATRAVLAARLNSLAQGVSGVRWVLLQSLADLLNHGVLPLIPAEGSVGASGDLTPLSYVAGVLCGEREVRYHGEIRPAAAVLAELGIAPLRLAPKEGLALMNGTAVMTGLACLAFERAEYLTRLTARLTALACLALKGNRGHFDPALFAVKPHEGQNQIAAWIYADLDDGDKGGAAREQIRLQDRYSIRCAPHVIGVLRDALPWLRRDIENELNSANDNPIIDPELERVLHGGHFYGGHIAFAMDGMKNAVANLADLMDRQLALLVDTRYNHGLPQNLSGSSGERAAINHGFKAVQITASACTAEALKLTMPASVFSRSTECHNQDKVSMGTIAARDALRVLQLTEQVAACLTLAVVQGVRLREEAGELDLAALPAAVQGFVADVAERSAFLAEDRRQDGELRALIERIQRQAWELYP
ncbi:histidine ammonia-lyase [Pseudogulbenkiania sp. MAI-1]|uniref:HAL/PAL/TAL family ammonia-lyase n=1 Tax=Pseudogulbenkiania sp. MAI-1 TaxID=990370 RepID=UPI00045E87DE|nr:aromatic amino acid ammonia-lyase [Pseudogulbenkiania sp. MAI-1]